MTKQPFFSIIIVCLNPGEKLKLTLESIAMQTFTDYEIIIKDGMSDDKAAEKYGKNGDERIRLYREADNGIYDAMNQAVKKAAGQFVYFLNCGDLLWNERVLADVRILIDNGGQADIFYGNVFEVGTGQVVSANPRINRFACYRHLPCHQACFYRRELLTGRPFKTKYQVRADYEHFLWCVLEKEAPAEFLSLVIARYEGSGFSETKANRRLSALEHREIARLYMTKAEIFKYRLILALTLAPFRTVLAKNSVTAAFYNRAKQLFYRYKC